MRYRDPAGRIRHQCGATGLSLLILMAAMAAFLTLAVDTGRLFMEKRRLQQQADLAALSLGRYGCYIDGDSDEEALIARVEENLAANGFDPSGNRYELTFGAAAINADENRWEFSTGEAESSVRSAAQLKLSKAVPASLLSSGESVTLGATANIFKRSRIEFGVGTTLVDINLLDFMLQDVADVELTAASYQNLVDARIGLGGLIQGFDQVIPLEGESVSSQLDTVISMDDLITVLYQVFGFTTPVTSVLDPLKISAGTLEFMLSDFLKVSEELDETLVLATKISAYDLISAALLAVVQRADQRVGVNSVIAELGSLDVLSLVTLDASLKVIEPPQFKFGELPAVHGGELVPTVRTAQTELLVQIELLGSAWLNLLNILGLGLASVDLDGIGIQVIAAEAETQLLDVNGCNWNNGEAISFEFASKPSLATAVIGDREDTSQPFGLGVKILLIPIAQVEVSASLSPLSCSDFVSHSGQLDSEADLPQQVSQVTLGTDCQLSGIQSDDLTISPLGGVSEVLLGSLVADILNPVLQLVIGPVLTNLGIVTGQADVFVSSFEFEGGNLMN
ncbi:pilus assembly protein TadG-related protein [Photobacterium atrarenae]|uniref:Pilus assembly protein TadG-related protein n=1 Tax=Photobacterium atrarenae TaxID=865757 RepID=A0ABY5GH91_9GAMM|nr:pilus assembly protein TadG-related protein [Photobacterium atrarenae]UTV28609.1 pilus assembly protein TadG-related protein [Photobacterium atrarenae]